VEFLKVFVPCLVINPGFCSCKYVIIRIRFVIELCYC